MLVDTYTSFAVVGSDANGDVLSWDIYSAASNGVATVDSYGNISYHGNMGYIGADTFTVRVADPGSLSDTLIVSVQLTPTNLHILFSATLDNYAYTDSPLWQYGVPVSGPNLTSGVTTDPYVWATNLSGGYPAHARAGLYFPVLDLYGSVQSILSMRMGSSGYVWIERIWGFS